MPVPNTVPPDAAAYQLSVPALVVEPKVTVPLPQTEPGVAEVIVGAVLTVAVTAVLVDAQPALLAST